MHRGTGRPLCEFPYPDTLRSMTTCPDAIKRLIDSLVYQLYGLPENEIAIIKEATP